jgi:lysophospholipid acyltransferase (LPLAT)-like uncharacterized protein
MGTIDYRAVFADRSTDPASDEFQGPVIAVFWHDSLLVPFYLQGNSETVILTSLHRDADWVASTADYLGFETVRGSTGRGGQQALLRMIRDLPGRNIGLACDGPRGPRHQLALGALYLSAKLGIPLVPYGIGYSDCWRLNSWDRLAIPRPFSRVHILFGRRIQIVPTAGRMDFERSRRAVESVLLDLTARAQRWAELGRRLDGQVTLHRRPMAVATRRTMRNGALPTTRHAA